MSPTIDDRPLLAWLESPSHDRGLHFAQPREGWENWSYARLADLTLRTSAALAAAGVRRSSDSSTAN